MRYRLLEVEDFLPFKGMQSLEFPEGSGVSIVYGRNGKGKTSLITAFRWAFTGEARGRGGRSIRPQSLVNKEAAKERGGPIGCKVRILFEADGHEFDLTRRLTPQPGTGALAQELILVRDGQALARSDAEKTLAEIMPPQVEQFFHFDAELLDQYEQLVDDDSAAGAHLRNSIEQILGVPVLENAARDLEAVADEAAKEVAKAAKSDARTRELGNTLEQTRVLLEGHQANLDEEDRLIRQLEVEYRNVEQQLAEQQNKVRKLAHLDSRRAELKRLRDVRDVAREKFIEVLPGAWKAVLVAPLTVQVQSLEEELDKAQAALMAATAATYVLSAFESSGGSSCPTCRTTLSPEKSEELRRTLADDGHADVDQLRETVQDTSQRLKVLRSIVDARLSVDLEGRENTFRAADVTVEDVEAEIRELESELSDAPTDDLRALTNRKESIALRLQTARRTYDAQKILAEEKRTAIKTLSAKIDKVRGPGVDDRVARLEELAASLGELFSSAIVSYRDTLKDQVAQASTELFRSMRTETDFQRLSINDQFGLRILDSSGSVVEGRSAGYEHLVALSLIGALQRCSPISGPIVMDSPFGRLDPEHRLGVLKNLDKLTDQVLLLVHEGEIGSHEAQDHLRGRLLTEHELVRVSATHTRIRERRTS